jgi:hypothetical protein
VDEYLETPEMVDPWRTEVLVLLRGIFECLVRAPWMQVAVSVEPPDTNEPPAVSSEPPDSEKPLPTWILTDEQVARVEEAVESEQRVRGRAYGG